ncbi:hypothetical protein D2Q93_10095 [Alicyclobacillaceae bacterium I2511]|nr:hypothetical protein D2Q93_10095 [Alicyclobacillaceae bacterium I2511]
MNWESAKSWLIAAFFVLDLILAWQVVQSRQEFAGYRESYPDLLANTKTLLSEHGLVLVAQVPTDHPEMAFLDAVAATPSVTDLGAAAFGHAGAVRVAAGGKQLTSSVGVLTRGQAGSWTVRYTVPRSLQNNEVQSGTEFLWQGGAYQWDNAQSPTQPSLPALPAQGPDVSTLWAGVTQVLDQRYQNFPLFDVTATLYIQNHHLLAYRQQAVENLHPVGQPKPILTAIDALDNLANVVDKQVSQADNRITSIQLGYVHKAPQTLSQDVTLRTPNYWFPVWQVTTTGTTYDINAFTGEVLTSP